MSEKTDPFREGAPPTRLTKEALFFCAGLAAGLITAAVAPKWPTIFTVGVGPVFFTALVVAIAMTNSWPCLSRGIWRYVIAAVVSTAGYVLVLVTFSGLGGLLSRIVQCAKVERYY